VSATPSPTAGGGPDAATSASASPLLVLEGIRLSFRAVRAIEDVGFRVRHHEICSVIGPNGAGKSSVLNVISGVYRPDAGNITFDGQREPFMAPRAAAQRKIARTFQNIAVFKGMSVLENVLTGTNLRTGSSWVEQLLGLGRARSVEGREREHAERVLEFLSLQPYRHAPVGRLAYGIQKRVELGRALAAEPKLLLLDEPMAGMNAEEKRSMSRSVLDINRELGTTIVLIEHDMRVVMDLSDHVVVLDYGRVVGDGTPDEVRQDPEVQRAYLGRRRRAPEAA
jgi:branched-chain amino acid transport system ATP-binding protein